MKKWRTRWVTMSLVCALLLQLSACGVILHPERQGQRRGRIDAKVAILDGIGLLFFVVPGVIAFAVDFATGTIYLPSKRAAIDTDGQNVHQVTFVAPLSIGKLEKLLTQELGVNITLKSAHVSMRYVDAVTDMAKHLYLTEHLLVPPRLPMDNKEALSRIFGERSFRHVLSTVLLAASGDGHHRRGGDPGGLSQVSVS